MDCIRNEPCHKNTTNCCFTCTRKCETRDGCNDEDCKFHPSSKLFERFMSKEEV